MGKLPSNFYNKDYFTRGAELGISAYDEHAFDLSNDIFEHQAKMLTDILKLKGKTVVEIGCALGNLVHHLRKLDVNAFGQDISVWAWRNSHCPIFHHIGNAEEYIYAYNVDAIVSFHTMEHLENPEKALRVMHDALNKGGIFFAVIPSDGHEHDPSGLSMHNRDWWHAKLTENGFCERKDLYDKFFWHDLIKKWNWEVYCYERS